MTAYYNEIDSFAAAWLRALISAGHIAPGDVDTRSIVDVRPDDLRSYTQCHFFAGIGVWSYALRRAGWSDDRPIWTGSCPCQPWSVGGAVHGRNNAEADARDLWPDWWALIAELSPRVVIGEQVASSAALRWFDRLASDMERKGYAVGAVIAQAAAFGQAQRRERIYFAADIGSERGQGQVQTFNTGVARQGRWSGQADMQAILDSPFSASPRWPQPLIRSVDDVTATSLGRLRGYGNAINAEAATSFIEAYLETKAIDADRHIRLTALSDFTTNTDQQEDIFA